MGGLHSMQHNQTCYDGALVKVIKVYDKNDGSPTKQKKHNKNRGCVAAGIISVIFPICADNINKYTYRKGIMMS